MARDLAGGLGGDHLAAAEIAAEKERVHQRPGDAGHQHQAHADEAVERALRDTVGIGLQVLRHQPRHERRRPEQQQRDRLVGHVAGDRPDAERERAADQIDEHRPPADMRPPQKGAPAVRRHLRDRMQHHRGGQRHQHQAARRSGSSRRPCRTGPTGKLSRPSTHRGLQSSGASSESPQPCFCRAWTAHAN